MSQRHGCASRPNALKHRLARRYSEIWLAGYPATLVAGYPATLQAELGLVLIIKPKPKPAAAQDVPGEDNSGSSSSSEEDEEPVEALKMLQAYGNTPPSSTSQPKKRSRVPVDSQTHQHGSSQNLDHPITPILADSSMDEAAPSSCDPLGMHPPARTAPSLTCSSEVLPVISAASMESDSLQHQSTAAASSGHSDWEQQQSGTEPGSNADVQKLAPGATTSRLLALPDACLLSVMVCCADDTSSVMKAATAHIRLQRAAVEALSSMTAGALDQARCSGLLQYLTKHGQHVRSLALRAPDCDMHLRVLPASLTKLDSLQLKGMALQLQPDVLRAGSLSRGWSLTAAPCLMGNRDWQQH